MNDKNEKLRVREKADLDRSFEQEENGLEGVSGMEKVREMTQSSAGEDLPTGKKSKKDDSATKKNQQLADQLILRERLLKHAPKEPVMKMQLEGILKKDIKKLEREIKKHKRRKNPYGLSLAIMKLREVIWELGQLAKISYEKMKLLWLKIVHNLA